MILHKQGARESRVGDSSELSPALEPYGWSLTKWTTRGSPMRSLAGVHACTDLGC